MVYIHGFGPLGNRYKTLVSVAFWGNSGLETGNVLVVRLCLMGRITVVLSAFLARSILQPVQCPFPPITPDSPTPECGSWAEDGLRLWRQQAEIRVMTLRGNRSVKNGTRARFGESLSPHRQAGD
jgi:hypothetical protein